MHSFLFFTLDFFALSYRSTARKVNIRRQREVARPEPVGLLGR
jgi:hypothetical protein